MGGTCTDQHSYCSSKFRWDFLLDIFFEKTCFPKTTLKSQLPNKTIYKYLIIIID